MKLFDPPPDRNEYRVWNETATRPLTDGAFGSASASRRKRCAELSARMTGCERPRRRLIKSPWTGRTYLV